MQPDATDWKIINILKEGQKSNSAIAKMLDVSEGTVRQRIKRLKDAEILTIKALINPEVLENQQLAYVMVSLKESKLLDAKAREISQLENVQTVIMLSGQYDLMIEVMVGSNKGLVKFLTETLSEIDAIATTQTYIALKTYNKFV
jgi:Lrp/AsnC family transcriptional regulator for asnA, asnC and gidA